MQIECRNGLIRRLARSRLTNFKDFADVSAEFFLSRHRVLGTRWDDGDAIRPDVHKRVKRPRGVICRGKSAGKRAGGGGAARAAVSEFLRGKRYMDKEHRRHLCRKANEYADRCRQECDRLIWQEYVHAGTLATASKQAGAAHPFGGHRKHALPAAKRRVDQAAKRRRAMESSGQALGSDPASGADGQLVLRTDVGHLVAVARESPQHVLAKRQADLIKAKASRASNMHVVVQWSARSEIGDYLGPLRAADPASVKLLPWSPPDVEAFTFRMFSWCPPSSTLCLKIMQGMVAAGVQGKLKDAWLRQAEMIRHDEQPDLKNRLADGSSLSGF